MTGHIKRPKAVPLHLQITSAAAIPHAAAASQTMICFIHLRIGIPPYLRFSFYKKMYLHTNSTASTYISGVIFFALPHTTLMMT